MILSPFKYFDVFKIVELCATLTIKENIFGFIKRINHFTK